MSLAGGTGSGLGTKITYSLRDSFPEAMIVNHLVWPYSSGEVVVQNYNSLLTLSHLQQASDLILAQQNDQLQKICSTLLGIKNVSFEHINDVIAHKLASILQPSYANKFSSVSVLYELVQALACHPSYKLACVKNVPHISQRSMEYTTYIWPALLKHLRQMLIADAAMEEGNITNFIHNFIGKSWLTFLVKAHINPFVPNAPFLYPLKTSENLTVFCFHGVEKGCIGTKWVKVNMQSRTEGPVKQL